MSDGQLTSIMSTATFALLERVDREIDALEASIAVERRNEIEPVVRLCCYKACKKAVKESPKDTVLVQCTNNNCNKLLHQACLTRLPQDVRPDEAFGKAVCGKRCCNAVVKRDHMTAAPTPVKKRVAWHNDGPSNDVSSLSCLLDWMTTGDNYSRYRDGNSQNGETKSAIVGEIVRMISKCGVKPARTSKDGVNKISTIEQSYRNAVDWLSVTGSGITNESSLKAGITTVCPEYDILSPIINDRVSVHPLLLSSDMQEAHGRVASDDERNVRDSDLGDTDTSVTVDRHGTRSDESGSEASAARKRPASQPISVAPPRKRSTKGLLARSLDSTVAELRATQLAHEKECQTMKLMVQQEQCELQRDELRLHQNRAADKSRESEAWIAESEARDVNFIAEAES